jgi:hypothetical protein
MSPNVRYAQQKKEGALQARQGMDLRGSHIAAQLFATTTQNKKEKAVLETALSRVMVASLWQKAETTIRQLNPARDLILPL